MEHKRKLKHLYPTQRWILGYIEKFYAENGYAPTLREIAEAAEIKSTSGAYYHIYIARLLELGLLEKCPRRPRSIRVKQGSDVNDQ